jgi:hypothetical protein
MFDIDHLLDVIKSVLTPEEYQEFLINLDKNPPLEDGSYYAFIGEATK